MKTTTVTIHDRFGELVDLISLDSAFEIYRFLSQYRIRQSIDTNKKAIAYSEDGSLYLIKTVS